MSKPFLSTRPEPAARPASMWAGLFFLGFLMVALNVLIDPRAVDVTLVPRLLALILFLCAFALFLLRPSSAALLSAALPLWRDPVVLSFAAYAVLTTLSLFFATNLTAGLTDVFRTWGALCVLAFACVLLAAMPDWPSLLAKTGVISAILSSAVGFSEFATKLGLGLRERNELLEVTGLMSNVNLYASFLLLVLPLCFGGIAILLGIWRLSAVFAAVAATTMILLLQTRAVYLGLAAAFVVVSALVFRGWRCLGLPSGTRFVLPLLSAAAVMLAVAFVAVADGNLIAERVRSIFSGEPTTAAGGRLVIWWLTLQMAVAHWATGVGAGNFPVLLHDYFNIDDPAFSTIHPNWLQPHNDFLWVFAEKGVFGLLLYLALFGAAFRNLNIAWRSDPADDRAWMAVAAAAALTGYVVVSLFDFPMERINHQIYLAVYLATTVILASEARRTAAGHSGFPDPWLARRFVACAMAILVLGAAYAGAALRQEWHVIRARINFADDDHEAMVRNARLAATPWKTLDPFATPVSFLEGWGLMFLARLDEALACFERARREMPARNYIVAHIGLVSALRGDYRRAAEAFSAALARSPDNVDMKVRLADCHIKMGDFLQAQRILLTIRDDQMDERIREAWAELRAASDAVDDSGHRGRR